MNLGNFDNVSFDGNLGGFDVDFITDYHDGADDPEVRRYVKDAQAAKDKAFKSARERLRETLALAWDGPQDAPVAAEVRAIAAPHVERLESGALRIDYAALERHRRELLAFHDALRAEYQARAEAFERDEEDAEILLIWS